MSDQHRTGIAVRIHHDPQSCPLNEIPVSVHGIEKNTLDSNRQQREMNPYIAVGQPMIIFSGVPQNRVFEQSGVTAFTASRAFRRSLPLGHVNGLADLPAFFPFDIPECALPSLAGIVVVGITKQAACIK